MVKQLSRIGGEVGDQYIAQRLSIMESYVVYLIMYVCA